MAKFPQSLQQMVEQFNRLPGIGTKTSERFVFWLLKQPKEVMTEFIQSFTQLRDTVQVCSRCYNFSAAATCNICADPRRDQSVICVVAEAPEVWAIEQTGEYAGVYHVLGGVVNQIEGVGPGELRIEELVRRAGDGIVKEIILATNPDVEGETTSMIITQALSATPLHISRIARGLPMGGDVEYADSVTLSNALKGRTRVK